MEFFKLYFEENKSELDVALLIAKLSMNLFMFSEALPYLEFCFNSNPDNKQLLMYLGHCHLSNSDFLKAKEVFEEYLKFNSKNRHVKKLLKKINKLLEKQSDNNPDLHQINDSNNTNPEIVVIKKHSKLKTIFICLFVLLNILRLSLQLYKSYTNYYNKPEKNIESKRNSESKLNDSIKK